MRSRANSGDGATENTQLLVSTAHPSEDHTSQTRKYIFYLVEGTLIVIGAGAAALYAHPVDVCVTKDGCGKWMINLLSKATSDLVAKGAATAALWTGAVSFGCINAYFSGKSVPAFIELINHQKTKRRKVVVGTMVVVYATTQGIQLLLASLGTSSSFWQPVVTTAGGAPGSLYSAVKQIPFIHSHIDKQLFRAHYWISDHFSSLSLEEKLARQRIEFYEAQHRVLLEKIEAKWRYIATHAKTIAIDPEQDPLHFLLQQNETHESISTLIYVLRKLSNALGFIIAAWMTKAFVANTYSVLGRYLPEVPVPVRLLLTLYLASGNIYSNFDVTMRFVSDAVNHLINKIRSAPCESFTYNLHPLRTSLIALTCGAIALFSYAVEDTIYDNEFSKLIANHLLFNIMRISADVSMDTYHFGGLTDFAYLITASLTHDQREKYLFRVEQSKERFKHMPIAEEIELIESDEQLRNLTGAQIYQPPSRDVEHGADTAVVPEVIQTAPARSNIYWYSSWFSCWRRSRNEAAQVDQTELVRTDQNRI